MSHNGYNIFTTIGNDSLLDLKSIHNTTTTSKGHRPWFDDSHTKMMGGFRKININPTTSDLEKIRKLTEQTRQNETI